MIDPDQHALDLLARHAPDFLSAAQTVEQAADNKRRMKIRLDQFDNNPLLLYAALHFCAQHGITVIVLPAASMKST